MVLRHLADLKSRNLRPQTVYNRHRALTRLARWLGGPILYATEDHLRAWQEDRAAAITAGSRAVELSHVREFYRWAQREDYRTDDPTLRLRAPRTPRRLPRPIADDILSAALAGADPTMAVVLGLAAFAGLRAGEIAQLDWSEVELTSPGVIRIVDGKGGHGRMVPLAPALRALLLDLPHRRGPVIRRITGGTGAYNGHNISHLANTYLHAAGAPETLHQCRHRFATAAYRACLDLRAVQDLLGHRSPATTAIYTAASGSVAVEAVTAAGHLAA